MADGTVTLPNGAVIDNTAITRPDGTLVERQRIEVTDGVKVSGDLLAAILTELRVQNVLLASAFGVNADLDRMRDDLTIQ